MAPIYPRKIILGSMDEEYYNSALEVFYESKEAMDSEIQKLLQQIAIKQDIITNLEGQITDKQKDIGRTIQTINHLKTLLGENAE